MGRLCFYSLSFAIFPALFTTFLLLATFRAITNIYLKSKYGSFYGGLLSGADVIWSVEDDSKNIINTLVKVEGESGNTENFIETLKRDICAKFSEYVNEFPKLSCIRQEILGYTYLLKNQIDFTECVTVTNLHIGKEKTELEKVLGDYSNKPLPKNNAALWEIIIFSEPIEWSNQRNSFPVLCRFNHIVGDGMSLTTVLSIIFGSKNTMNLNYLQQKWRNLITKRKPATKHSDGSRLSKARNLLYFLHVSLIAPILIFHQSFLRKCDVNTLHGPPLSGEKILVYTVEENAILVPRVKKIKRRLPAVSFTDIILTAISNSLDTHFQKVGID